MSRLRWTFAPFSELRPGDLYDALALRSAVFVVEQNCVFQDADGFDQAAWHLLGRDASGLLVAYLRVLEPGAKYPEPSIGRVISHPSQRRQSYGRELMAEGIRRTRALYPEHPIRIGAQARLERFYQGFGFTTEGPPYIEDGIPHLEMVLAAAQSEEQLG